jgi:hypothetical protein
MKRKRFGISAAAAVFTAATPVTANITVYAKWTVTGGGQTNAELLVGTWYDSKNNTPATFISNSEYQQSPYANGTYTKQSGASSASMIEDTGTTVNGCAYSEKETRSYSDGNKSTQYLLSIPHSEAVPLITAKLGSPDGVQKVCAKEFVYAELRDIVLNYVLTKA